MKKRMKRHAVVQPLNKPYRLIALTQGQNAIVDAADFEWLDQWNWSAHWNPCTQSFYAMRMQFTWMHRVILGCGPTERSDHKNHDTLDNRRENLRKCTHAINMRNKRLYRNNTSGYKGVSLTRCSGHWHAEICVNNKTITLGEYVSKKDAALAYDKAARRYFGAFAQVNFPLTDS